MSTRPLPLPGRSGGGPNSSPLGFCLVQSCPHPLPRSSHVSCSQGVLAHSQGLFCFCISAFPPPFVISLSLSVSRYLVEELKKREGFELVMEVCTPLPTPAYLPQHSPDGGSGAVRGDRPPSTAHTSSSLIPPSLSLSMCVSGSCPPACGGRKRAQITVKGCLR